MKRAASACAFSRMRFPGGFSNAETMRDDEWMRCTHHKKKLQGIREEGLLVALQPCHPTCYSLSCTRYWRRCASRSRSPTLSTPRSGSAPITSFVASRGIGIRLRRRRYPAEEKRTARGLRAGVTRSDAQDGGGVVQCDAVGLHAGERYVRDGTVRVGSHPTSCRGSKAPHPRSNCPNDVGASNEVVRTGG